MEKTKEFLNKEDMIKLDEEIELIPLTFDFLFKGVFMNDLDILKEFILSQLNLELKKEQCNIELLTSELPKENKKEYQKTVDIYVKINNYLFVNIEVNREYFKTVKLRNMIFADKLYSMILETSESTNELNERYLVQINLNAIDKYDNNKEILTYGSDKIVLFGLETKQVYTENKYILIKFLEYYRNLFYNKHKKLNNSEMWLVMLTSKNFQELYDTLGYILDDEKRDEYIRKVIRMCNDKFIISEWYMKRLNEVVEGSRRYYEKKTQEEFDRMSEEITKGREELDKSREDLDKGRRELDKGRKELTEERDKFYKKRKEILGKGYEDGKTEGLNELVKNMIIKNYDINEISEITNLTKDEIIKIKESL